MAATYSLYEQGASLLYSKCLQVYKQRVDFSLVPRPTPFFCSSVSVDNNTRIHRPSASVYYCQRKPKNRKNGVGLGTRLG